jgi:hypothetical protein
MKPAQKAAHREQVFPFIARRCRVFRTVRARLRRGRRIGITVAIRLCQILHRSDQPGAGADSDGDGCRMSLSNRGHGRGRERGRCRYSMANDHFHYGLTEWVGIGELDKVKRLLAEFIPVSEGAGIRPEHKLVRSHLMLKYASQFRCSPNFIDIPAKFQEAKGLSLADYQALCFGLFAKCTTFSIEELQRGASAFTFVEPNFHAMALPKRSVTLFLEEVASTPEHLSARIKHRDYGPNDFTELRKHPLISVSKGFLPIDIRFLVEKFESGPYWAINDIDKSTGDRLRRLWGEVFEVYMNDLLTESLNQTGAQFIPDPRCAEDPSRQVCGEFSASMRDEG